MSWVFIEPADVWLFRDGKPFDAGSDHRAHSLFPPNPTTVQGAIRSKILIASGASLAEYALGEVKCQDTRAHVVSRIIGWPGRAPPFRLNGPFVTRCTRNASGAIKEVTPYFPLPSDVLQGRKDRLYRVLSPLRNGPFRSNWPQDGLLPLWARTAEAMTETSGWLDQARLLACLNGIAPSETDVLHDDQLFAWESRFGVGIDSKVKRPEEGLLYQIEFTRPRENVGLLLEVDDSHMQTKVQLPEDGLLSIGGENRAARYAIADYTPLQNPWPAPGKDGKRVKLYFATPAWFAGGWTTVDWVNYLSGANLRLVAAAVRRALSIGGARVDTESQKGNIQKAMHRYVPAGSVFYFEAEGPIGYTGGRVTDLPEDGQIGFGQVLVGTWDYA